MRAKLKFNRYLITDDGRVISLYMYYNRYGKLKKVNRVRELKPRLKKMDIYV